MKGENSMKFTEAMLDGYSKPLSTTEDQQCKNAIRMVSDALKKLNYTDDGAEIRSYATESYSYTLDLRQKFTDKKITLLQLIVKWFFCISDIIKTNTN